MEGKRPTFSFTAARFEMSDAVHWCCEDCGAIVYVLDDVEDPVASANANAVMRAHADAHLAALERYLHALQLDARRSARSARRGRRIPRRSRP